MAILLRFIVVNILFCSCIACTHVSSNVFKTLDDSPLSSVDGGVLFRNGAVVGGGATVNNDLAFAPTLPVVGASIEAWRRTGLIDAGAFRPTEILGAYSYVRRKIGTRNVTYEEINANNGVLFSGGSKLGRNPSLYHLNTYAPGTSPSSCDDKRSPVDFFIRPALQNTKNPLVILEETTVELLEAGGSRHVHRLKLRKKPALPLSGLVHDPHHFSIPADEVFSLEAQHVILSAGTLGSAALLLRSRIENN